MMSCKLFGLGLVLLCVTALAEAAKDKTFIFYVFTEKCFSTYFTDFNFLDVDCFKSTLNKALSYAIVLGAVALKVPQVFNIVKTKSVVGLSLSSLYLDVAAFLPTPVFNVLNGNPFMTWAESLIVLMQNVALVFIFWIYTTPAERPPVWQMVAIPFSGVAFVATLFSLPANFWWTMPTLGLIFTLACRGQQIAENLRQGHTGNLAGLTWLMNFVGGSARVFTSLQDPGISDDSRPMLVGSFAVSATMSFIVLAQIGFYWTASNKALADAAAAAKKKDTKKTK